MGIEIKPAVDRGARREAELRGCARRSVAGGDYPARPLRIRARMSSVVILVVVGLAGWGLARPSMRDRVESEISTGIGNELRSQIRIRFPRTAKLS